MSINADAFAKASEVTANWRSQPGNAGFSWEQFRIFLISYEAAKAMSDQPDDLRKAFEQHLYETDGAPLDGRDKLTIDCFIDFLNDYTPKRESSDLQAKLDAAYHLLNHIHREVASLEDFDAASLMEEIEQTLNGTRIFDDNQALWRENERLKAERHWQPIETAPKDGTVIIIHATYGTVTGCWHNGKWMMESDTYHPLDALLWMPMPPLPEIEDQA